MPFDDEMSAPGVLVVPYRTSWPGEFELLGGSLASVLGAVARRIDHVGSTSVPGLAAKDCLDVSVSVDEVGEPPIDTLMTAAGYRQRPEPWNRVERSFGVASSKLVYAPAVGARPVNVHVRTLGGPGARCTLLFRDYLRADDAARGRLGSAQASARAIGARHLRLRPDQDAGHRDPHAGGRALGRRSRLDTVTHSKWSLWRARLGVLRVYAPTLRIFAVDSRVRPSCGSAS